MFLKSGSDLQIYGFYNLDWSGMRYRKTGP